MWLRTDSLEEKKLFFKKYKRKGNQLMGVTKSLIRNQKKYTMSSSKLWSAKTPKMAEGQKGLFLWPSETRVQGRLEKLNENNHVGDGPDLSFCWTMTVRHSNMITIKDDYGKEYKAMIVQQQMQKSSGCNWFCLLKAWKNGCLCGLLSFTAIWVLCTVTIH